MNSLFPSLRSAVSLSDGLYLSLFSKLSATLLALFYYFDDPRGFLNLSVLSTVACGSGYFAAEAIYGREKLLFEESCVAS